MACSEIAPERDFLAKAAHAIRVLREELPPCCREHLAELARTGSTALAHAVHVI